MNHDTSTYLMHHGVKGMRWGVRKDKNRVSVSPPVNTSKEGVYYRVGKAKLDPNKSGALYVSKNTDDAARYVRNLGPNLLAKVLGNAQTHVQTISPRSKLKEASEEETVKTTLKFFAKDKKALSLWNQSFESLAVTGDYKNGKVTKDDINNVLKDPKSKRAKKLAFGFNAILGNPEFAPHATRLYDDFRSKGYDAIPDLLDQYGGTSKSATLIINPQKVQLISSIEIDKDTYKRAKRHVKKNGKA